MMHASSLLPCAVGLACVLSFTSAPMPTAASPDQAAAVATADCVTIGAPKPSVSYTYRYTDTTTSTEYTNQWVQFSATGSELITTRVNGRSTYNSRHSVADDVFVLESSAASGTDPSGPFANAMTYKPGAIGDPAYRACVGKTWTIAAVNATSKSGQGSFSVRTDPGTMQIVAVRESVTVPAGTFSTVRYTKTMNSGRGQVFDEFWKSIEHGVTVKRNSAQPGGVAAEVLIAVK